MPDRSADDAPDIIWVRSDTMPDGSYGVSFSIGPDLAWTLTAGVARRHALSCFAAATIAEHDAAVVALLRTIGIDDEGVGQALKDIRERRGLMPVSWPSPHLQWRPSVTLAGKPFLLTTVDGATTGQCGPGEVRSHAVGVLAAITAVRLDTDLRAVIRDLGLDQPPFDVAELTAVPGSPGVDRSTGNTVKPSFDTYQVIVPAHVPPI